MTMNDSKNSVPSKWGLDGKQSEESLRKEMLFSESIITSLPGVFYLLDETGKFLKWNKNLELVTGRSAEEMARINPLDLFEGEDKTNVA
jgi:PAS domain S-box-containing protein